MSSWTYYLCYRGPQEQMTGDATPHRALQQFLRQHRETLLINATRAIWTGLPDVPDRDSGDLRLGSKTKPLIRKILGSYASGPYHNR